MTRQQQQQASVARYATSKENDMVFIPIMFYCDKSKCDRGLKNSVEPIHFIIEKVGQTAPLQQMIPSSRHAQQENKSRNGGGPDYKTSKL